MLSYLGDPLRQPQTQIASKKINAAQYNIDTTTIKSFDSDNSVVACIILTHI